MSGARIALLAATGALLVGGASAQAADLGGNCCADLEERIAELEATTVRKGNRKVSLTISGYVDKAVLFWDDGFEKNAYVVDNDFAQTRIQFAGKAKVTDDIQAGYRLEFGIDNASSDGVTQTDPNAAGTGAVPGRTGGGAQFIEIRQSHWFLESKKYGKVSVGLLSGAQDDLYKWGNVGKAYSDAELHYNGQFGLRLSNGNIVLSRWDNIANNLDNSRQNAVRYDTPALAGFVLSTSWGADDVWDVALRYDQKFGDIHVKAGVSYTDDSDGRSDRLGDENKDFVVSAGISDKKTGLYVYGAYGNREIDQQVAGFEDNANYWYIQPGINVAITPLGNTNFHVDYGEYTDWGAGTIFNSGSTDNSIAGTRITSSDVTRYGTGVTQNLKAADMDLYAVFNYYQADVTTQAGAQSLEDWYAVTAGARINF
ncbi:MAG: hypothetical protein WC807_07025 [Hyphomicrobium sp.]|jgi:hypothetical protein